MLQPSCTAAQPVLPNSHPPKQNQPGRQWNRQNQSQLNPSPPDDGSPCTCHGSMWWHDDFVCVRVISKQKSRKVWGFRIHVLICGINGIEKCNCKCFYRRGLLKRPLISCSVAFPLTFPGEINCEFVLLVANQIGIRSKRAHTYSIGRNETCIHFLCVLGRKDEKILVSVTNCK